MAKLDDFGRPIYETAEEYNKAHKGGVCPRPYDDPNGSNHQDNTVNRTKNYKIIQRFNSDKFIFSIFYMSLYVNKGIRI